MATVKDKRSFTDLDLSFRANPFTKDVYLKTGEDAVKTALRHLILTKNFERPFHPEIGTQVSNLLFENFSPAVRIALENTIRDSIEKFEPRVRLIDLRISETEDNNDLELSITYTFKNIDSPVTLTTLLSRVR
jgi:phage baseplate assembly protein W